MREGQGHRNNVCLSCSCSNFECLDMEPWNVPVGFACISSQGLGYIKVIGSKFKVARAKKACLCSPFA